MKRCRCPIRPAPSAAFSLEGSDTGFSFFTASPQPQSVREVALAGTRQAVRTVSFIARRHGKTGALAQTGPKRLVGSAERLGNAIGALCAGDRLGGLSWGDNRLSLAARMPDKYMGAWSAFMLTGCYREVVARLWPQGAAFFQRHRVRILPTGTTEFCYDAIRVNP